MKRIRNYWGLATALTLVGFGAWFACEQGASVAPTTPPAPSDSVSGSSSTEATDSTARTEQDLDGSEVGAMHSSVLPRDELHAVRLARRLRDRYGASWQDIAIALEQLGKIDRKHMVALEKLMRGDDRMQEMVELAPEINDEERARRAEGWDALRDRIRREGRAPVPPAYGDLAGGRSPDERGGDVLRSLQQYLDRRKSASVFQSPLRYAGTPVLFVVAGVTSPGCYQDCQERALEILYISYEVCYDDFAECCPPDGMCPHGPDRDACSADRSHCIAEAQEIYYDWYYWCISYC